MVLLHNTIGEKKTFGDLAEITIVLAFNYATNSNRIDMIFAVYKGISIKNADKLNAWLGWVSEQPFSEQKILLWGSVLWCYNTKNTCRQVAICWMDARPSYLMKLSDITYQEDFVKIDRVGTWSVYELASSKEEADTWILLHTKHAHEKYCSYTLQTDWTNLREMLEWSA